MQRRLPTADCIVGPSCSCRQELVRSSFGGGDDTGVPTRPDDTRTNVLRVAAWVGGSVQRLDRKKSSESLPLVWRCFLSFFFPQQPCRGRHQEPCFSLFSNLVSAAVVYIIFGKVQQEEEEE